VPDDLQVGVNLSVRQASRPDLVDTVVLALVEAGLPPQVLALEVTESVLIEADETTLRQLAQLHDMGVLLGLDDFGTGYSSLSYLKRLPVSFIKIDKSFVSGIVDDPSDRQIVTAVIRLAQALGVVTIAEGVENTAQLSILQELGCDQAQGFLFGRPRPGPPDGGERHPASPDLEIVGSLSAVVAGGTP
jgi:EAL domain-containing protein (putative c-di-GMP-specific phosphodiesterase class I)